MGVDLGDELVALRAEPVHRLLGLPDQVHQPGRVAAPDLASAGDAVGGRQQQPGQQADQRHAEAPGGRASTEPAIGYSPVAFSVLRPTYVNLVGDIPLHRRTSGADCL